MITNVVVLIIPAAEARVSAAAMADAAGGDGAGRLEAYYQHYD